MRRRLIDTVELGSVESSVLPIYRKLRELGLVGSYPNNCGFASCDIPLASKNYLLEKQKFQQSTNVRVATNAIYGSIVYVGQDTGLSTRRGRIITGWSHHGSLRLEMISEVSLMPFQ